VEALRFFKNYLNRKPDAPNREDLEKKIAALEEEIASEAKAKTAAGVEKPPPPTVVITEPPPPPKPIYKRWWLWTAVGGAVAVGVAVGLGVGLTQTDGSARYGFARVQF
jgi:hypothetical protein